MNTVSLFVSGGVLLFVLHTDSSIITQVIVRLGIKQGTSTMLKVTYLNADTSSILSFSPAANTSGPSDVHPRPLTIVIDPWLRGATTILDPLFYTSTHSAQPSITSLSDIEEPDVVLITHDKPDHCHRETLTTLSPNSRSIILAIPSAARQIRSWNHFKAENILSLPRYDSVSNNSIYRHAVPTATSSSYPGEISIAYIAPSMDISGLRVAIGITYLPPHEKLQDDSTMGSANQSSGSTDKSSTPKTNTSSSPLTNEPLSAKDSRRTLSVIYSPHGLPYQIVKPYVESHLAAEGALPLSLLMHCFKIIRNPWYLGGLITTGAVGGSEIAVKTRAEHWVSTHDEEKNDRGFSVSQSRITRFSVEEIQQMMHQTFQNEDVAHSFPKVFSLSAGQEYKIG